MEMSMASIRYRPLFLALLLVLWSVATGCDEQLQVEGAAPVECEPGSVGDCTCHYYPFDGEAGTRGCSAEGTWQQCECEGGELDGCSLACSLHNLIYFAASLDCDSSHACMEATLMGAQWEFVGFGGCHSEEEYQGGLPYLSSIHCGELLNCWFEYSNFDGTPSGYCESEGIEGPDVVDCTWSDPVCEL